MSGFQTEVKADLTKPSDASPAVAAIQSMDEVAENLMMGIRRMHNKFGISLVHSPDLSGLPEDEQLAQCGRFASVLLGLEPSDQNMRMPAVASLARTIMQNTFPSNPFIK